MDWTALEEELGNKQRIGKDLTIFCLRNYIFRRKGEVIMFTQVMGKSDMEADSMEIFNRDVPVRRENIMGTDSILGTDSISEELTNREWRHDRRVQNLKREHRQKFPAIGLALAVIICLFLICIISYSSIKVQANTGFKYYTSITVENGETLWSIADRYIDYDHYKDKNAYIAEIENINHLDNGETILAGRLLIVPYYSMEYVQ